MAEARSKPRTRYTDTPSQIRNRPGMCGLFVENSERLADDRIASACEPANLFGRKPADVAPQGLHEQQFRKFGKHKPATCIRAARGVHREADRVFEPLSRGFFSDVND